MHKNGTRLHPQTPMNKPIARKGESGEGGDKLKVRVIFCYLYRTLEELDIPKWSKSIRIASFLTSHISFF